MNPWYIEFFETKTHNRICSIKIACEDDWDWAAEKEQELEEEGISYYTLLKTYEDYY